MGSQRVGHDRAINTFHFHMPTSKHSSSFQFLKAQQIRVGGVEGSENDDSSLIEPLPRGRKGLTLIDCFSTLDRAHSASSLSGRTRGLSDLPKVSQGTGGPTQPSELHSLLYLSLPSSTQHFVPGLNLCGQSQGARSSVGTDCPVRGGAGPEGAGPLPRGGDPEPDHRREGHR